MAQFKCIHMHEHLNNGKAFTYVQYVQCTLVQLWQWVLGECSVQCLTQAYCQEGSSCDSAVTPFSVSVSDSSAVGTVFNFFASFLLNRTFLILPTTPFPPAGFGSACSSPWLLTFPPWLLLASSWVPLFLFFITVSSVRYIGYMYNIIYTYKMYVRIHIIYSEKMTVYAVVRADSAP